MADALLNSEIQKKNSPFSLPKIFNSENTTQATSLLSYPWLLSTSPSRFPFPSFWTAIKEKHLLVAGTSRAQNHLHSPKAYDFPMQFNSDVGAVFLELLEVLSDPILSTNEETLRSIMTRPLVERFRSEHQKFLENGEYVEYIVPELRKVLGKNIASTTIKNVALSVQPERKLTTATGTLRESDAALQDEPSPSTLSIIDRPLLSTITESYLADRIKLPKVTIRGIHFTYGPFPAPQEYVQQHWWSLITLLIPPGDDSFVSHPRQQEIMKIASDQGVVMRIDVRVDLDRLGGVEFVHWDKNGIPTVRDKRSKIDLQFISPHFTPWDELFELDEAGEWRLRFRWRISDIDGLLTSQQPVRNTKHKIDWKTKVI